MEGGEFLFFGYKLMTNFEFLLVSLISLLNGNYM